MTLDLFGAGTATAGDGGTATAGDRGTATAGDRGTATAGYGGTATAGDGGTVSIKWWDDSRKKYHIRVAEVGEDGIVAGGKYQLDTEGKFVRVEAPSKFLKREHRADYCGFSLRGFARHYARLFPRSPVGRAAMAWLRRKCRSCAQDIERMVAEQTAAFPRRPMQLDLTGEHLVDGKIVDTAVPGTYPIDPSLVDDIRGRYL